MIINTRFPNNIFLLSLDNLSVTDEGLALVTAGIPKAPPDCLFFILFLWYFFLLVF